MAPWISWKDEDCEIARDEGWYLCGRRHPRLHCEIRRIARRNRFVSDIAAERFVRKRARAGSILHQVAILVHDFYRDFWKEWDRARSRKRPAKKLRCKSRPIARNEQ